MTEPKTAQSIVAEMARYLHASKNGGFDGDEHPEEFETVRALVFNALYPITFEQLAGVLNGTHVIVPKAATAAPAQPADARNPDLSQVSQIVQSHCYALLNKGSKIEAIKYLRSQTGCGLKEAKDYVESL